MEHDEHQHGQFPLMELCIRMLRKLSLWNQAPGGSLPIMGYLSVGSYMLVWVLPSFVFIVTSEDNVTLLLKAVTEQIVFFTIFYKFCSFVYNFRQWESLFYDLQRTFATVQTDPNAEVQAVLTHVRKVAYYLTRYYCTIVTFNMLAYGTFPMIYVIIKYAITGTYSVPLSTPIEGCCASTLEEILSGQMLFLYTSTIFALCLLMTVISVAFNNTYLLISMFFVLGYCMFQTFCFSMLGTELIEESASVANAIFHSSWYSRAHLQQRDLAFILLRAQRPVKLTAAKLFVVTRMSFTQVMSSSILRN
ncbi:AGAP004356-PA-like protein [Anopheles sinensis]|uniref:AGAP004356-PA-like protein n=1 Tax=Anopheles sinensis TaxID=74873 RepID=A0A084WQ72_ANOSI|nr:AGAP004356-PA-like protein [Anopheles sinensis]